MTNPPMHEIAPAGQIFLRKLSSRAASLSVCGVCAGMLSLFLLVVLTGCGGRHRPGGDKPGAAGQAPDTGIRLVNVVPSCGITYQWSPLPHPLGTKEAFGCGCAFLDYDNDGWQDVLLVAKPHPILYRNLGNGHFQDVTHATGLDALNGDWTGCAVGDYDGDGYRDILFTGFHRLALMRNVGGKRFVDMTRAAGLDPQNHGHWGSSAGFMDLNGTGRLDLVILNYVVFGPKTPDFCELTPGVRTGCPPTSYQPEFAELWQNVGGGRFRDVTAASGLKTTHGKALVLAFMDLAHNGRPDFYIGNDGTDADLMQNLGGMHFRNIGITAGVDSTPSGGPPSSMGADWGDYDRDGRMDLVITNFSGTSYQLYHNLGHLLFEHREAMAGIAEPTFKMLGFGTKWADVDNDGWPDILFANGHVYDNPGAIDHYSTFLQPLMLFHNEGGQHFTDIAPSLGGDVTQPILGRGLATGDYDNDGRMDFLVVNYQGAPLLLHNVSQTPNHWVTFDLRGRAPNWFAYGAAITARAGGQVWVGYVSPASSYLSSSDPRVHFGLGPTTVLDTVAIVWPDGKRETLHHIRGDRIVHVGEGRRPL